MRKMPFPCARDEGFTIQGDGRRRCSSQKRGKSCGRLYVVGTKSSPPLGPARGPRQPRPPPRALPALQVLGVPPHVLRHQVLPRELLVVREVRDELAVGEPHPVLGLQRLARQRRGRPPHVPVPAPLLAPPVPPHAPRRPLHRRPLPLGPQAHPRVPHRPPPARPPAPRGPRAPRAPRRAPCGPPPPGRAIGVRRTAPPLGGRAGEGQRGKPSPLGRERRIFTNLIRPLLFYFTQIYFTPIHIFISHIYFTYLFISPLFFYFTPIVLFHIFIYFTY